jgi:RND family efflux transporter MFP subunit
MEPSFRWGDERVGFGATHDPRPATYDLRLVTMTKLHIALLASLLLAGCKSRAEETSAAPPPALLGVENIAVADTATLMAGPVISGTLTPELGATVRAEITGTMVEVDADQGMTVKKGQVLGRIDDAALRDAFLSARAGLRTAESNLELQQHNLERTERLHAAGAVADRELETAQLTVKNAEGAAADARSRTTTARRQLDKATLRAPFSGIVSESKVSEGDVVSSGTELFSVVDPSTMRLEAAVPVERLSQVKQGMPVQFTVTGYADREFDGRIERVNPVVDPATRQVRVIVTIPNATLSLVAGLFAQGSVATESRHAVVVPSDAVDRRGVRPVVVRLKQGRVEKVDVEIGLDDTVNERTEITSGLAAGDTVLMGAAQGLTPGTVARVRSASEAVTPGDSSVHQ